MIALFTLLYKTLFKKQTGITVSVNVSLYMKNYTLPYKKFIIGLYILKLVGLIHSMRRGMNLPLENPPPPSSSL